MAEEMSFESVMEIFRLVDNERRLIRRALILSTPENIQIRMYLENLATKIKRWWRRKRSHPKYYAVRKIQRWWMNRYDRYWTNMQKKIAEGPEVKLDFRRATKRAITRIFEMYARDEEKHFMEEVFLAEREAGVILDEHPFNSEQRDYREEFERAFREHILSDLWMLRFGKEETQQKIEELWEELCED